MTNNQWFGYKHVNDTIHVKRFLSLGDMEEAQESPYVVAIYGPFEASSAQEALHKLQLRIHGINE